MSINKCLVLAASLVLLASCGDSGEPDPSPVTMQGAGEALAPSGKAAAAATGPADVDPCSVLTDELLQAHFTIAPDTPINRRLSDYSPHPLCTVTWRKADADEIEARRGEAMNEYIMAKARGEKVSIPNFRTDDEMSLTLYQPLFESPGAAQGGLDQAMSVLQKGVSASHKGVEATFQADVVPVAGVGDKAAWAAKLRQLSVASGRRLFHVTVNTGAEREQELETARAVAGSLAERL